MTFQQASLRNAGCNLKNPAGYASQKFPVKEPMGDPRYTHHPFKFETGAGHETFRDVAVFARVPHFTSAGMPSCWWSLRTKISAFEHLHPIPLFTGLSRHPNGTPCRGLRFESSPKLCDQTGATPIREDGSATEVARQCTMVPIGSRESRCFGVLGIPQGTGDKLFRRNFRNHLTEKPPSLYPVVEFPKTPAA